MEPSYCPCEPVSWSPLVVPCHSLRAHTPSHAILVQRGQVMRYGHRRNAGHHGITARSTQPARPRRPGPGRCCKAGFCGSRSRRTRGGGTSCGRNAARWPWSDHSLVTAPVLGEPEPQGLTRRSETVSGPRPRGALVPAASSGGRPALPAQWRSGPPSPPPPQVRAERPPSLRQRHLRASARPGGLSAVSCLTAATRGRRGRPRRGCSNRESSEPRGAKKRWLAPNHEALTKIPNRPNRYLMTPAAQWELTVVA